MLHDTGTYIWLFDLVGFFSCASVVATVSSAAGCYFLGLLLVLKSFLFLLLTHSNVTSALLSYKWWDLCFLLGQQQM